MSWILLDIYGHKTAAGQGNLPKELRGRAEGNGVPSIVRLSTCSWIPLQLTSVRRSQQATTIIVAWDVSNPTCSLRKLSRLKSPSSLATLICWSPDFISEQHHPNSRGQILWTWWNGTSRSFQYWAGSWGLANDLLSSFTTFDILGDLAFGESFNCLISDSLHVRLPHLHYFNIPVDPIFSHGSRTSSTESKVLHLPPARTISHGHLIKSSGAFPHSTCSKRDKSIFALPMRKLASA